MSEFGVQETPSDVAGASLCPAEGVSCKCVVIGVFLEGGEAAAHPPVRGMLEDGPDVSHLRVTGVHTARGDRDHRRAETDTSWEQRLGDLEGVTQQRDSLCLKRVGPLSRLHSTLNPATVVVI